MHYNPSSILPGLAKAFPGATIQEIAFPTLEEWKKVHGQAKQNKQKKEGRLEYFDEVCRKKGVALNPTLRERYISQDLPPKKFLEENGYWGWTIPNGINTNAVA